MREGQETNASTSTIDGAKADSSAEQESSSDVATLNAPVAAAPAGDSAEGRSSQVGGEGGGAEQAPSMAAVGLEQEVDTAAVGGGQSKEEEVMAELLAQQPGGQEELELEEGDDGAPKPMVGAGVSCCLVSCFVLG